MANKILNLIFKATDKATPTLDNLKGAEGKGGIGGITGQLKGLINPATMAMGAVAGLGVAVSKSITDWRTYTQEVGDFNAMIDGTIEETSVLIDISKRYSITMDTMLAAMRSMANSGLEPNIEGLISLRETLDNTTSASERLALAQRMIGEQGIKQILPMLEQLTDDELRNYIDTMEEGNIVTEEQLRISREMEMALSDLDSMWKGFTRGLVTDTVPVLNDLLYIIQNIGDDGLPSMDMSKWLPGWGLASDAWIQFGIAIGVVRDYLEDLKPVVEDTTVHIGEMAMVTIQAREAQEELNKELDIATSESGSRKQAIEAIIEGRWADAAAIWEQYKAQKALNQEIAEFAAIGDVQLDIHIKTHGSLPNIPSGGYLGTPSSTTSTPISSGFAGYATWAEGVADKWAKIDEDYGGYQTGGSFEIGGIGGSDSQRVSFMGTPGEQVNISKEDSMAELLTLMRRMPIMIADAVERVM